MSTADSGATKIKPEVLKVNISKFMQELGKAVTLHGTQMALALLIISETVDLSVLRETKNE